MKKQKNVQYQTGLIVFLFVMSTVLVTSSPFQILSDVNPDFTSNLSFKIANASTDNGKSEDGGDFDGGDFGKSEDVGGFDGGDFGKSEDVGDFDGGDFGKSEDVGDFFDNNDGGNSDEDTESESIESSQFSFA